MPVDKSKRRQSNRILAGTNQPTETVAMSQPPLLLGFYAMPYPTIPDRPYQTEYHVNNVVYDIPGRLKSHTPPVTVLVTPPDNLLTGQASTEAKKPSKRTKTSDDKKSKNKSDKSLQPEPIDEDANVNWKRERARLRTDISRSLKDAHLGGSVHCIYDHDSLEESPIFEIIVPYNVMAVLVSTFKNPVTLDLLRKRCDKIAGVNTCIYYPLEKDQRGDTISWEDNNLIDNSGVVVLSSYFHRVCELLKGITGNDYVVSPTYIETVKANHQKGHLDDEDALKRAKENLMYILHIPMTAEGRVLRVWSDLENVVLVHTSFGRARMLRADIIHGGCYGRPGNCGLAVKFIPKPHIIAPSRLLHVTGAVFQTTPEAISIHDLAWGHVRSKSLGKTCPSAKYIAKFKEMYPILFRNGQDPTLLAPDVTKIGNSISDN